MTDSVAYCWGRNEFGQLGRLTRQSTVRHPERNPIRSTK
jgi:hypothetical protein